MGELVPKFSEGDPQYEVLKKTMRECREIDPRNIGEIMSAYNILTDPVNELHLANPPKDEVSLILAVQKPSSMHYFGSINALGELVAVATLSDAPGNINSHEIGNFAVRYDLQRQAPRESNDRTMGAGKFTLEQVIYQGFTTLTWDGREREKLRAGVMAEMTQMKDGQKMWVPVPRANVMIALLKGRGFSAYTTNPDGSDRPIYNQVTKVNPSTKEKINFGVIAFELHRDDWIQNRRNGLYTTYNEHDFSSTAVFAAD